MRKPLTERERLADVCDRLAATQRNMPVPMTIEERADLRKAAVVLRRSESSYEGRRTADLGVIEFQSDRVNPGLAYRFYDVVNDLHAAGSIVDLWLMDIATVLKEFGYEMTITTDKPSLVVPPPPQE